MNGCLIAPPSHNRTPEAALAWTIGAAQAAYPVTNLALLAPDLVAKTTGGTARLQATLSSVTLQGVALINTNLGGQTLTLANAAGLSVARPVTATADGLGQNVYWDLRGLALTTSGVWTIDLTGPSAGIAIGTLLLIQTWESLRVRWNWSLVERFPVIEHRTGYGKRLHYQIPVRSRRYEALPFDPQDRAALRQVRREAHGGVVPWTLVPDVTDDAVLLVQFVEEEHEEKYTFVSGTFPAGNTKGVLDMPLNVEEANAGVAL